MHVRAGVVARDSLLAEVVVLLGLTQIAENVLHSEPLVLVHVELLDNVGPRLEPGTASDSGEEGLGSMVGPQVHVPEVVEAVCRDLRALDMPAPDLAVELGNFWQLLSVALAVVEASRNFNREEDDLTVGRTNGGVRHDVLLGDADFEQLVIESPVADGGVALDDLAGQDRLFQEAAVDEGMSCTAGIVGIFPRSMRLLILCLQPSVLFPVVTQDIPALEVADPVDDAARDLHLVHELEHLVGQTEIVHKFDLELLEFLDGPRSLRHFVGEALAGRTEAVDLVKLVVAAKGKPLAPCLDFKTTLILCHVFGDDKI